MRRRLLGQARPVSHSNSLSRELDWLVDQWAESTPETRQMLILTKIRQEEKLKKSRTAGV